MDFSSVQKLCIHLISSAYQRCRLSEDLCRLSVVLESNLGTPIARVSISDTGTGSCLEEFQDLKCSREGIGTETWDGLLSVKTTDMSDNKIYHYHLNLRESVSSRRLTRLPSIPKNDAKFSGTEVCLSISDTIDALLTEIKRFFQKMLILMIPCVAAELVVKRGDAPALLCENVFLPNECSPLNFSSSNVERFKSGLEEYVLKHGNSLNNKCDSCFRSREQLKISSGVACSMESQRGPGLIVEAVIAISEHAESPCFRSCSNKAEVLHFKDFLPCSVPGASLNALTSIDWRSYGLTLGSVVDQDDHALIEWENLPPHLHLHMAIHCYHKQVIIYPGKYKYQPDRHLIKKAVKLALDDFKGKYTGFLLSAHAVKICSYAPDLASSIAGIILSSNDSEFRSKCALLLGLLQSQEIGRKTIEDCINGKIISVIETNDRKPEKSKETAPFLFEDDRPLELEPIPYSEEYEGGDDVFSFPD
ncbi:type 2 DNA topoisomerase 6 subunit B-like [Hibiscus syriacus]|uniref:type 2 DNA topoisomerase 6 subunit B-like n=1 Tax=Hibiscus syriacus TaxID=106335 RepID=UPI001922855D|nr:type 2 DNA topoisomerase 6 subunit B-like [Hibiscus syriacus]